MFQSSSFLLLLVFSSVMIHAAPFDQRSDGNNVPSDEKTVAAANCDFGCVLSHIFPGIGGGNKGTEHENHGLSQIFTGAGTGNPVNTITGNTGNPVTAITGNTGNTGNPITAITGNTGAAGNTGNTGFLPP